MAEGRCYVGGLPAHLHLRLELCRPAGHTHDRPEPGLLPQADALDDGHHLALRRRLLHIPQSHLRHGPPGLLAGSTAAGDVQGKGGGERWWREVFFYCCYPAHMAVIGGCPFRPITVRSAISLVNYVHDVAKVKPRKFLRLKYVANL